MVESITPKVEKPKEPIKLAKDIVALINYLNDEIDVRAKANMWNKGKFSDDDDEYEIANRSRIVKGSGKTLWQITSESTFPFEVVSEGQQKLLSFNGENLKMAIKKVLAKNGYELVESITPKVETEKEPSFTEAIEKVNEELKGEVVTTEEKVQLTTEENLNTEAPNFANWEKSLIRSLKKMNISGVEGYFVTDGNGHAMLFKTQSQAEYYGSNQQINPMLSVSGFTVVKYKTQSNVKSTTLYAIMVNESTEPTPTVAENAQVEEQQTDSAEARQRRLRLMKMKLGKGNGEKFNDGGTFVFNAMPFVASDKKDKNIERYGYTSQSCEVCGKPTHEAAYIHYTTVGDIVNTDEEDLSAYGYQSQGFFPIGSECAKKYPKEFIFTLDKTKLKGGGGVDGVPEIVSVRKEKESNGSSYKAFKNIGNELAKYKLIVKFKDGRTYYSSPQSNYKHESPIDFDKKREIEKAIEWYKETFLKKEEPTDAEARQRRLRLIALGIKMKGVIKGNNEQNLPKVIEPNLGKAIEPRKEVSKSVQVAIREVLNKWYLDLGDMEATMLFNEFKNLDLEQYSKETGKETVYISGGMKEKMFEKLNSKYYVGYEDGYMNGRPSGYTITDKGIEFINRVKARIETRVGVKEGYDLFPDEMKGGGGISDVLGIKVPKKLKELKEVDLLTNGGSVANQECDKGCFVKGDLHTEGGEAMIVKDIDKPVEIERDELIIIEKAVKDKKVRTLTGTNLEVCSQINVLGGGKNLVKDKSKPTTKSDNASPPELTSGQVVIMRKAVADKKVYNYTGTNRQILNEINTKYGGKPI